MCRWSTSSTTTSGSSGCAARWGDVAAAPRLLAARARSTRRRRRWSATLAELDPAAQGPHRDHVVHTGPVVAARRHVGSRTWSRPSWSASARTTSPARPTMQQILDAVDGLPARVVVTTGPGRSTSAALRVPATAELHDYVDHDELMPDVTAVVGHGGHATTMRGARARPAAAGHARCTRCSTRRWSARRCSRPGPAGCCRSTRPPREIRPAVEELLADGPHRTAAARLGAAIRAVPGATTGADALEARHPRSCGARSPFGSILTLSRPSQAASTRSSARSSSRGVLGRAVLGPRRLHDQPPLLAVRLEVDPGDDLVAEQERQHVVAVHPLVGGRVDLDAVVEVEELLGALPEPHDRVERAQERAGLHLAGPARVAVEVRRPVPPLDRAPAASSPSSTSTSTAGFTASVFIR